MDLDAEIKATEQKLKETGNKVEALNTQRQELLQELLRLDGELRALRRLKAQSK